MSWLFALAHYILYSYITSYIYILEWFWSLCLISYVKRSPIYHVSVSFYIAYRFCQYYLWLYYQHFIRISLCSIRKIMVFSYLFFMVVLTWAMSQIYEKSYKINGTIFFIHCSTIIYSRFVFVSLIIPWLRLFEF